MNVSDIMYTISLAGDYQKNGLADITYDSKTFGPVYMKIGEQNKLITFTYKLPTAFSGDLGINIRASLKSGVPMGVV